ncbi:MAG: serine/threonine protein kinase [Planctomycetota bacterium]
MGVLLFALAIAASVLVLIFVLVPVFKGLGWLITNLFRGIGWLVAHVFEFVGGMIGDVVRFVGALIALVVLSPMALLNVVIGRWSAAGHFAESVKREVKVAGSCVYRFCIRRPLKLVLLHGLLEGVEERVPEAMAAAPSSDKPSKRTGQFPGYTIVGSLKGGGSGAKLYIAHPDDSVRARYRGMPDRVVIKSFALSEGSSLPQIVRESRALECAKQLGLVFEHGMDPHRFFYVMPYHAGDHLGIVTRQLHGETDGSGLGRRQLATSLKYAEDLVGTLSTYHRGGLWHKDVKPDNIIINEGRALLVDLGLVTPLRSAMTLTTHGTEYFRDPELVRQALRGVKVHQINGAKFDIYAAGAVMYFMIENTFPPHGALSRFSRKSPDALRWIVRRAMADYAHRYETADQMLADLRHVSTASDPFAVRPADLPSMRGGAVAEAEYEAPQVDPPAAVAAPMPPPIPEPAVAAAGAPPVPPVPPAPVRAPRLKVTNWWTGAYTVEDPGTASAMGANMAAVAAAPAPAVHRRAATSLRHEVQEIRHQARTGAISARKAAREQVRAARTRAKEIRKRARRHRNRAVAERQPSIPLLLITAAALVVGGVFVVRQVSRDRGGQVTIAIHDDTATASELDDRLVEALGQNLHRGKPVLLVPDVKNGDPQRYHKIAQRFERQGYDVITDPIMAASGARVLIDDWKNGKSAEADEALEDFLARFGLYGVIDVSKNHRGSVSGQLVWSSRDDAEQRRYIAALPPAEGLPYLLINDHPVRHDPALEERVGSLVHQLEVRGWTVVVDDDLEATLRKALPVVPVDETTPVPDRVHALLTQAGLGGILHVHATQGEGDSRERVNISAIRALPSVPVSDDAGNEVTVTPENEAIDSSAGSYDVDTERLASAA